MNLFNLVAKLSLDDKDYKRKIQGTKKDTDSMGQSANTVKYNIAEMKKAVSQASRAYGKMSEQTMKARDTMNKYILGLDDATFKNVYLADKLGLSDEKLQQQAHSIQLNARKIKMLGSVTERLTQRMAGLQKHGVKPEDLMPASTVGIFERVNGAMTSTGLIVNKLSAGYRALGGSVEKVIKNYSVQKVAIREAKGDMVKYGLILRNLQFMQGQLALGLPIMGVTAVLVYKKMFESALEADKGLKKLTETAGAKFKKALEPVTKVAGQFLSVISKIVIKVSDWVIKMNEAHPTLAKILGVIGFLAPALTLLLMPLALGVGLWKGWALMINMAWTAFGGIITAMGIATSTFLAIAGIVGGLVLVFKRLYDTNEQFRKQVQEVWGSLLERAKAIWESVAGAITGAIDRISKAFSAGGLSGMIKQVGAEFGRLGNWIIESIPQIVAGINTFITTAISFMAENSPKMWNAGLKLLDGILKGITENLPLIIAGIQTLIMGILSAITTNLPMIIQGGVTLLTGLIDGITQALPAIINATITILNTLITIVIENLPMIIDAGIKILMAVIQGISNALPQLINAITGLIPKIVNAIITNLPKIIDGGIKILNALIQGLTKAIPQLLNAVIALIPQIVNAVITNLPKIVSAGIKLIIALIEGIIKATPQILSEIGRLAINIVKGLWEGIKNMAGWFKAKITGFFSDMFGDVKEFLGIHSPSRLFRDEIGKMIPRGMAIGIQTEFDTVDDALTKGMTGVLNLAKADLPDDNNPNKPRGQAPVTINNYLQRPYNEIELAREQKRQMQALALGVL